MLSVLQNLHNDIHGRPLRATLKITTGQIRIRFGHTPKWSMRVTVAHLSLHRSVMQCVLDLVSVKTHKTTHAESKIHKVI